MSNPANKNRLALEKSPYLLQHAGNPVDWYPWGTEAFEKASLEDKPIFLSIGYSTCHWCHVMAHESFEDTYVSQLMNDVFVSIKVDREERPDIDNVYMTVCQMMTGSGGWPLTIIMTPERRPFFAATYIPRETRSGRVGMLELIPRIRDVWLNRRDEVLNSADQVNTALQRSTQSTPGDELREPALHLAYRQLDERFDEEWGGFGSAPKFPTPHNLLFLLRHWQRTGNGRALAIVEKTLQAMRRGGIYDHIGFGFHRYSTDQQWLVPHFEKMLYDQALLAVAYLEAYQATRHPEYAETAREIFAYVQRDMTAPDGGFYSAEDADSEGEEGKFYLWKKDEIKEVLTPEEADRFSRIYDIREEGNFPDEALGRTTSRNILHLTVPLEKTAAILNLPQTELKKTLESWRQKLFKYRERRVHPHKDDKILTDWNGLMIGALAFGARALDEPAYAGVAGRAVSFIFNKVVAADGHLLHRYRDGEAAVTAHLDDYAFLVQGLLELYETTFDINYLKKALELQEYQIRHFWDGNRDAFYFTSDEAESLLVRQKEIYDGALPSGNSVTMLNLLRLGRLIANPDYEARGIAIGRAFYENVAPMPSVYTQLMVAVDFALGPVYEVVIAGEPQAADTKKMLRALRREFLPNKIAVFLPEGFGGVEIKQLAPFTEGRSALAGQATAYVCVNYECRLPTTDAETMLSLFTTGPAKV
jgi:uncharacterized protein YyaL (SSP411 family)